MINYVKYRNGIRVDMMGNYHGGCEESCCRNSWGHPTTKGIEDNCKIKHGCVYTTIPPKNVLSIKKIKL